MRRRLAWVPRPVDGESLVSWVWRVGAEYRLGLVEAAALLGLGGGERLGGLGGLMRLMDGGSEYAALLDRVVAVTGLEPGEITALTFDRYRGTAWRRGEPPARRAIGLTSDQPATPFEFLLRDRSNACPRCVVEDDGRWRVSWRLPWSFACPAHGCLLLRGCLCGRDFSSRHAAGDRPCLSSKRVNEGRCPVRAADFLVQVVRDPALLECQQLVSGLAERPWSPNPREQLQFARLHHVAWMVIYLADSEVLGRLGVADPAVIGHFAAAGPREGRRTRREGPFGLRRAFPAPPEAAAGLLVGWRIAFAPNFKEAMGELLEVTGWNRPFASRAEEEARSRFLRSLKSSPVMAEAFPVPNKTFSRGWRGSGRGGVRSEC